MKVVSVDDVLKILHKYGKYIFVTDEKRYSSMVDEIANLKALEQQPYEDCISRQTVLDMLEDINAETEGVGFYYEHYVKYIKDLPSVTPKEKTGKWIPLGNYDEWGNENSYKCSECGERNFYPDNYCHNCGAKMIEPQESEDKK